MPTATLADGAESISPETVVVAVDPGLLGDVRRTGVPVGRECRGVPEHEGCERENAASPPCAQQGAQGLLARAAGGSGAHGEETILRCSSIRLNRDPRHGRRMC